MAVVAVAASAAETIATATSRTERPSRTIDGALLVKRPITHRLTPISPHDRTPCAPRPFHHNLNGCCQLI